MSYSCSILQSLTLLLSLPEGHPGGSSNVSLSLPPKSRAGRTNLQRTTAPLVPQLLETALDFLLDAAEPLVEVRASKTRGAVTSADSSLTSALRDGAESASAHTGKQLAGTAATCSVRIHLSLELVSCGSVRHGHSHLQKVC